MKPLKSGRAKTYYRPLASKSGGAFAFPALQLVPPLVLVAPSNQRRIEIQSKSNHRCNHRIISDGGGDGDGLRWSITFALDHGVVRHLQAASVGAAASLQRPGHAVAELEVGVRHVGTKRQLEVRVGDRRVAEPADHVEVPAAWRRRHPTGRRHAPSSSYLKHNAYRSLCLSSLCYLKLIQTIQCRFQWPITDSGPTKLHHEICRRTYYYLLHFLRNLRQFCTFAYHMVV